MSAGERSGLLWRWLSRHRFFVLLAFTYFYFHQGSDPNQTSRLALIHAMVERGATDITPEHALTLDKGRHGTKMYSDKAPGLALLVAPAYAVIRTVDKIAGHDPDNRGVQRARLHALSFLSAGLPGVIGAWCLLETLVLLGTSRRMAELLTAGWALGSLVFPFATLMFGHVLAATLLLGAFYLLQKWRTEGKAIDLPRAALLGLLWSGSIVVEYPTGMLVAVMGLYALSFDLSPRSVVRVLGGSALGAIVPFGAHAIFAMVSYGTPLALPYKFLVEPIFVAHVSAGVLGIGVPTKIGVWGALLSPYRGLFFLCPLFALVFMGFSRWYTTAEHRRVMWVSAALVALYMLFATSYYAWDGGGSTGSRHLVPSLAFYVIAISFYARSSRRAAILTGSLVVVSIALMYVCTAVIVQNQEQNPYLGNPLYQLIVPSILRGDFDVNIQDAFYARGRSDAVYNVGTLLGASPRGSLLVLPLLWALAYSPDWLPGRLRRAVA